MSIKKSLDSLFRNNTFLPYLILFEIAFLLFYFIQSNLSFPDPDSFYHVKMALLMKENGLIREFPWLQFTTLKEHYADHHLIYHILLIPFVTFLPPLLGGKLAAIIFSSAAVTGFYWLLKKFEIRGAWFYTFVLATSASFIFRLNLAKAQGLALLAYFFGLYLIDRKKYVLIGVFSFAYVWLYGGWPLILVLVFLHFLAGILFHLKVRKSPLRRLKAYIFDDYYFFDTQAILHWVRSEYAVFIPVIIGVAAGLVINPYFPDNLFFYWQQIVQIAVINYRDVIGVGAEWGPYNPLELMASASIAFIVLIVALTFFVLTCAKQTVRSLTLFLLFLFFSVLTVRSRRNVEYLIPTMLAFSGSALTIFSREVNLKSFFKEIVQFFFKQRILFLSALLPMLLIPYVIVRDVLHVRGLYAQGQEFDKFAAPSQWLYSHSRPGDIVFTSDWDEFPVLFYHNTRNYYIVGLDPTFMYNYNKELHEKYVSVTLGEEAENLYSIIKNDFRAAYVFVSLKRHKKMDENLQNNFLFEEVYKDEKAKIYKVL